MSRKTIKVDYLARVEGEGALHVAIRDGVVGDVRLKIFEPPRFFEALLRERDFTEAPDITARICGICPAAYQMSSVKAMEDALGIDVGEPVRLLRRLFYCGEWIESHGLHVYMLHAPDFLGYESAVAMAREHRAEVERGLRLKKVGNEIMTALGGREIHPINVRVGGFYRVPTRAELRPLAEKIERARDDALATVHWVAGFDFPDFERDYEFVALRDGGQYPMNEGRIVSTKGLDIEACDFDKHIVEEHVPHSTALQARIEGRGAYLVGPMARYNLNADTLSPLAREAARDAGLGEICANPFRSIVVRAVEILYACDEALRLIEAYEPPDRPAAPVAPAASVGYGCTEAPRGLLYHRYRIDADGSILDARIVPPTSQNQKSIEDDLRGVVERGLHLPDADLKWRAEQTIRNYDPCISCSAHFLTLDIDRR